MISDTIIKSLENVLPMFFDDPMFTVDVNYQKYNPATKTYTSSGVIKALDLGMVNTLTLPGNQNYLTSTQTLLTEQARSLFIRNEDISFDLTEEDAVRDRVQIAGKNIKINKIEPILGTLTYIEINQ